MLRRVCSTGNRRVFRCGLTGLLLSMGMMLTIAAHAQSDGSAMGGAESRMLESLLTRFQPVPSVQNIWAGAFEAAARKSEGIRQTVDSLERSGMDETELLVQVGALRQELKVIRQDRNTFIAGFLTPLQRLSLDSLLNPAAPSIQHFGFHDRLKCLVCKKPGELSVPPGVPPASLQKNIPSP